MHRTRAWQASGGYYLLHIKPATMLPGEECEALAWRLPPTQLGQRWHGHHVPARFAVDRRASSL